MSLRLHLVVPGYIPLESRCLSCSGVSRVTALSPSSLLDDLRFSSNVKLNSHKRAPKVASFACRASSTGHRRNLDLSRQNKQGFSRNRNRQNEDRENNFENFDESDILSSKNGPFFSFSSAPKSQATAVPGPREKEIVELFRKVQAKLRERAVTKEDKKAEASKGKGKENENVESLLKLLRKHSIEHGKKKISDVNNGSLALEQPEQSGLHNEDKRSNLSTSTGKGKNDTPEPKAFSITRPPSNFHRKSPVPQVKFQQINSTVEDTPNVTCLMASGGVKQLLEELPDIAPQPELVQEFKSAEETELIPEQELEPEPEPELLSSLVDGDEFDKLSPGEFSDVDYSDEDVDKQQPVEDTDFSSLKLAELRSLAKSRGIKGFSKMKKGKLVELLAGVLVQEL